ncbi:unnamed protein product, partial [Mesorhabditis belari]|uniref:STPR domain-containing protein n=1 Tax=Mesorhabditis belari TaxID=2138241 RepID=A0AAF3J204_9BILA
MNSQIKTELLDEELAVFEASTSGISLKVEDFYESSNEQGEEANEGSMFLQIKSEQSECSEQSGEMDFNMGLCKTEDEEAGNGGRRSQIPSGMSKHVYYYQRMKEKLTPEQWEQRIQRQREKRHMLTPEAREERRSKAREQRKEKLASETEDERALRLAKLAARTARRMSDPEQKAQRQEYARKNYLKRVETETEEQKKIRVQRVIEFKKKRISNESPAERELRLFKKREENRRRAEKLKREKEKV